MFKLKEVVEHISDIDGSPYYSGDLFFKDSKIVSFVEHSIEGQIFPSGEPTDADAYNEFLSEQGELKTDSLGNELDLFHDGIRRMIRDELKLFRKEVF